ncbi:MAG: universal stress protein [Verrucomicrobiota bacterium]|jgi:nucleotide-binding universal stress UspA family protein
MIADLNLTQGENSHSNQLTRSHSLPTPAGPHPGQSPIREILVPTDFSEHSNFALRYAMSVAKEFNSRITLLHVIEPATVSGGAFCPAAANYNMISISAEQAIARTWEHEKSAQPLAWRSMVREGIPYHMIIQTAKAEKSDLIIIATHGRTGLAHIFMGSTTEKVIRRAPCPVLVVRLRPRDAWQPNNGGKSHADA